MPEQAVDVALVDDLHASGFTIVAYDLAAGRCTRDWALKHVADRAEWWPGAQSMLATHRDTT